ncbi:DUF6114 domain-containing protein [Kitasatospora sp. NPDC056531]|uniref:DUF6114 domain-containing protein n=1 Tax=Kitasatospora sp. NPDC056531 TaxID=3345856 RepID=UPI0036C9560B
MWKKATVPWSRPGEAIATARWEFRVWRGTRPFWAGLLTFGGGLPILYFPFPYAHFSLGGLGLALSTTAGAGSLLIGSLLITLGVTLWLQEQLRIFAGVAAILLSLLSVPVANFGGFFLGVLPGLIGGSLACAWAPPSLRPEVRGGRGVGGDALGAEGDGGGRDSGGLVESGVSE